MVRISVLNDALRSLSNAEKRGHRQCLVRPSSRVVIKFLALMAKKGEWGVSARVGGEGRGEVEAGGGERGASARALAIGRRRPSGRVVVLACPSRPSTPPRHARAHTHRVCARRDAGRGHEERATQAARLQPMNQKTTLTSSLAPSLSSRLHQRV